MGLWISDDLSWSNNCTERCKKAYSRLPMLTRLKNVGVNMDDLIDVYVLNIRSVTEYCSVAWHSRLTSDQKHKLERIQRTSLKVILGDMYVDYMSALEMTGLESLDERRLKRCRSFSLKCVEHPRNRKLFPLLESTESCELRSKEFFNVNFARTTTYKKSTIPFCQRLLNKHVLELKQKNKKLSLIEPLSYCE